MKKNMSQPKIVKSVCNMCTNHCGINVYVQDGKVVDVDGMPEHPLNRYLISIFSGMFLLLIFPQIITFLTK